MFPFIVDEETEKQDIAAGDVETHAKWRNKQLECRVWYPIELEQEGRFGYGVLQISAFLPRQACAGKVAFVSGRHWRMDVNEVRILRFGRQIGTARLAAQIAE